MNTFESPSQGAAEYPAPSAELVDRYLAGECTDQESMLVRSWAMQYPNGETALNVLQNMKQRDTPAEWDPNKHWLHMKQRISDQRVVDLSSPRPGNPATTISGRHRFNRSRVTVFAAGIVAILLLSVGTGLLNRVEDSTTDGHVFTYTTAPGERATITLPDSTRVILSVASRLEVPANYSSGNRTVNLVGEALFTVNHHNAKPFTVLAGPSITKVLGTKFAIRHYPTDSIATVAVSEGKVDVNSTVLTNLQQTSVDARSQDLHTRLEVLPAHEGQFTFADGTLTLDEMPLKDAVVQLGRWYDADIRIGDPALENQRFKGSFAMASLSDVVDDLSWIFNVRVVREGRTFTLYPK